MHTFKFRSVKELKAAKNSALKDIGLELKVVREVILKRIELGLFTVVPLRHEFLAT